MEYNLNEERCIVIAVNENYIPYLSVMLISIVENVDQYYNYYIVIMHENISKKSQGIVEGLKKKDNVKIEFLNVSNYIEGYDFFTGGKNKKSYLSKETYFRLLAPELLPQYEKVLYLDCDVVVKEGWTDIFNIDMHEYLVSAVNDIWGNWECYNKNSNLSEYRKKELELDNPLLYFNAGVLLLNVEMLRQHFSSKFLVELAISKNWKKHDQDLLNYLCKGKTLFLDYSWNLIECPSKKAWKTVPESELEKYCKGKEQPRIIHYASRKPWIIRGCFFEDEFWKMAVESPYFEELFSKYIEEQLSQGKYLEEKVCSSIKQGKIGVRFIMKCITYYLKRILRL